ncbi:hypothetical protein HPB48_007878 [Haemaphysalis longicornis]|uniref:Reverse transcriptase domain-containing protein n=1 Tax=Haemaphysalis longicornis TaxID=44386 RepID=A0A9J6FT73_HAELO|nr:hypothetical protein HPB48_007878 [Haemaphysalis longicornis]
MTCPLPPPNASDDELIGWRTQLLSAKDTATKTLDPTPPSEYIGIHLRYISGPCTSLERRWRKHKHRRNLELQLTTLRTKIEEHAATKITHVMTFGTSSLARRLVVYPALYKTPLSTKPNPAIAPLQIPPDALCASLKDLYMPPPPLFPPSPRTTRAPPTRSSKAISHIPKTMPQPKHSDATLRRSLVKSLTLIPATLPKTQSNASYNYSTTFENTTPFRLPGNISISHLYLCLANPHPLPQPPSHFLKLCLGKLFQHVLKIRIPGEYGKSTQAYPPNMLGFPANLYTQEALLQLNQDFHVHPPLRDHTSLLSLDLQKSFDNISHYSILQAISGHNLGTHFYHYV